MKVNADNIDDIISRVRAGDRRLTSRLITGCESSSEILKKVSSRVFPLTGNISYTGIAGSFGVGKSTLLDGLIKSARKEKFKVGVVAVDPESPFSGGAILGDRIRMNRHSVDEGVFIRSLSSKSASVAPEVAVISRILELWGADMVFIETAGLGQTQVEISSITDIVLLLLQPQGGDDIQLMKAGIMEIADIIAITKCDILEPYSLKSALLGEFGNRIVDTCHHVNRGESVKGTESKKIGIFETGLNLPDSYDLLFQELKSFKFNKRMSNFRNIVQWLMIRRFRDELENRFSLDEGFKEILDKNSDPFSVADELFGDFF